MIAAPRNETRDPLAIPGAEPPASAGPAPGTPPWTPLFVAADYCKGCSLCIGVCESRAIALDMERVNALGYHPVRLVDAAACTSCALCARVCPDCVLTIVAPPRRAATRLAPAVPAGGIA